MKQEAKTNGWCIVGFICAFLIPLLGLIFSIIGLTQIRKSGEKGKGLAIAGIIVSCLIVVMGFVIINSMMSAISIAKTTPPVNYGPYIIKIYGTPWTEFTGSIGGGGSSRTIEGTLQAGETFRYKVMGWPVVAVIRNKGYGTIFVEITDEDGRILNRQSTSASYGIVTISA